MAYSLNQKIKDLEPYEPISGTYKIRLDANESPFSYTDEIKEKIAQAVKTIDYNRYPDPLAEDLCTAFAGFYDIDKKLVTAANGSDELISLVETAFLMKGEKLLFIAPDFSMYKFYSSICEVECVQLNKNPELKTSPEDVIKAVKDSGAKCVIFSNPCNPTGQGLNREEIRKIVSSVDALVVDDEAYMDFWDQSMLDEVENYDNLIIFRTASKAVSSAALRLGFAVANEKITRALKAVKSPYNVNSVSQKIGTIIFAEKEYFKKSLASIVYNRDLLYNGLRNCGCFTDDFIVYPTVTNFVFVKTTMALDIWKYLLSKSVAIRYMGDYIRISAGTDEETEFVLKEIENYLKNIKKN